MWNPKTQYESHGIKAKSFFAKEEKIQKDFDVGIFFSTFESRGLVSSELLKRKSCRNTYIVFFDEAKNEPLRKKNDRLLLRQISRCSKKEPFVIRGHSVRDVEKIMNNILGHIPAACYTHTQEWFIDIVGAPKPYFLGLLGNLRSRIRAPKLTLFNPTGDYGKNDSSNEDYSFTAGFDSYMWVPWLWGRPIPALSWTYIFLLGFEGNRSYEIFDRFEPRYVKALLGNPGYKKDYFKKAIDRNTAFLKAANPKRIYSNAADAVETWRTILDSVNKDPIKTNICIVPLGSKPHALGGGLAALTSGSPAVLYLMPRSFKIRDIPRGEYVWIYEISF